MFFRLQHSCFHSFSSGSVSKRYLSKKHKWEFDAYASYIKGYQQKCTKAKVMFNYIEYESYYISKKKQTNMKQLLNVSIPNRKIHINIMPIDKICIS